MIKPLFFSVLLGSAVLPCIAAEVEIAIDGNDSGRIYEGLGAVSAGASSELLIDYPEPYRSDILDYLFKPKFGAAFQHLKVEFGGGENSTCGAEASHAITKEELANPKSRGYEFWLMKEARKRNPDIILEGLPWTFPWYCKANNKQHRQEECDKCNRSPFMCKAATDKIFTEESADWLVAWIVVAKRDWDLDVDWLVAAMNESGTDKEWVKLVRKKLDEKGFSKVKIQGPDDNSGFWEIFEEFEQDPEYDRIVEAVGYHYLNGYGAGQHVDTKFDYRDPSDKVKATGKPLWASEDWSFGGDWGPAKYILRGFNEMYANDRITKYLIWAGFDSIYKGVDYSNVGVITADQPWSGYYNVREGLWVVSHYTQFAVPGWKYLNGACGQFSPDTWTGSYVTIRDPDSGDWSMIISTADDEGAMINAQVGGGLKADKIYVWQSNAQEQFIQRTPVVVKDGKFSITLEKGSFYTLTTTTGQQKGLPPHKIPALTAFPSDYADDFEGTEAGVAPKFFSDQKGTFEVAEENGNKFVKQIMANQGAIWARRSWEHPWSIIGPVDARQLTVSADVKITDGSVVEIGGGQARRSPHYRFALNSKGEWQLILMTKWKMTGQEKKAAKAAGIKVPETHNDKQVLATGVVPNFDTRVWHAMQVSADSVTGMLELTLDGDTLVRKEAELYPTVGPAYIASSYHPNQFDNLKIISGAAGAKGSFSAKVTTSAGKYGGYYNDVVYAYRMLEKYNVDYNRIEEGFAQLKDQLMGEDKNEESLAKGKVARDKALGEAFPLSLRTLNDLLKMKSRDPKDFEAMTMQRSGAENFVEGRTVLLDALHKLAEAEGSDPVQIEQELKNNPILKRISIRIR